MLEEHNGLGGSVLASLSPIRNPLEVENEAILSGYVMLFNWITSVPYEFTLQHDNGFINIFLEGCVIRYQNTPFSNNNNSYLAPKVRGTQGVQNRGFRRD